MNSKICTSIEQSKKLAEILPIESADMYYSFDCNIEEYEEDAQIIPKSEFDKHFSLFPEDILAWSLSALLDMLDYEIVDAEGESCYLKIDKDGIEYQIRYEDRWNSGIETKWYDNSLDACYEMIVKLNELKML